MGGVLFFLLLFSVAARLVSHGKWMFRYWWSGQTVLGHKKTLGSVVSWWQLRFIVILSANANANMLSASR